MEVINYEKQALDAYNEFNELLSDNWLLAYESNGVTLSRLAARGKTWCLSSGVIDVPMEHLIEFATVVENRTKWDNSTAQYALLEQITPEVDVVYTATKNHMAISARDFVNVRYSKRVGDSHVSCSKATTHKDKPVDASLLRGETHCSGWKFTPEGSGTRVFYLCGATLGGWIPQSVVDYGIEATTMEFYSLCAKHYLESGKNVNCSSEK